MFLELIDEVRAICFLLLRGDFVRFSGKVLGLFKIAAFGPRGGEATKEDPVLQLCLTAGTFAELHRFLAVSQR